MAGENANAIDVTELSLPQLTKLKQDMDSQIDIFANALQQLKMTQKKLGDSQECVEKLTDMKEGKPLLVPLTDSMYAPGQLDATKTVLIDIGTGYYVEKEPPEAIDYFKRKVKFVTSQLEKVQRLMKEKLIVREVVIETMENKIQATLAAQQATASAKS